MESSLAWSCSSQRRRTLGHKGHGNWTDLQIVHMLLSNQKEKNIDGEIEDVVQYPCCQVKMPKKVLLEKCRDYCIYCGCYQQVQQAESKIILKDPQLTLCPACFDSLCLIEKQGKFQLGTAAQLVIEALNRCQQCEKILGLKQEMNKDTIQVYCNNCYQKIEDDLERQSAINVSGCRSYRSYKSIHSFIHEDYFNPIEKPGLQTNAQTEGHRTDSQDQCHNNGSIYQQMNRAQLLDEIKKFCLKVGSLERKLNEKQRECMALKERDHSEQNSPKADLRVNVSCQPELNSSKHSKKSKKSNESNESGGSQHASQADPISGVSPFSKQKNSGSSQNSNSKDSLDNTEIGHNNLQSGKDKDEQNSNVGPEKAPDPNDNQIEIITCSQDQHNDFLQDLPPVIVAQVMLGSYNQVSRISREFEDQAEEENDSKEKQHKYNLAATAPVIPVGSGRQGRNESAQKNKLIMAKKNSNIQ